MNMENIKPAQLSFELGTLILDNAVSFFADDFLQTNQIVWDKRTLQWKSPGLSYREIVLELQQKKMPFVDLARDYDRLSLPIKRPFLPRDHQTRALESWSAAGKRGVISLPTGAGKTYVALMAIATIKRPTLVVVPTIDLLRQWQKAMEEWFEEPIGLLGGGERDIRKITVSTYDSAVINIQYFGNKFGLLIVDECHHLPAPQYQTIALAAIAPFRLGLSATVERADGGEKRIFDLLGPLVYEENIHNLVSNVLSPYDVVSVKVPLSPEERDAYQEARNRYISFVRKNRIPIADPGGWMQFVFLSARSKEGREAMRAYREQKKIAQASVAKIGEVWRILTKHRGDRIIIFTDDNDLAYRIGLEFILPVLTHQTKLNERKLMLQEFSSGGVKTIVTSKVLNEGVDVPEANVGVIVSGSGAVREHVQRLGRILRHRPEKRAILYEIISENTSELRVNKRRKQHLAYQRPS